ncbi:hypothetical protein [Candidatus Chromulinivorax destructor]|nr:hypothetical protein [Candidatus Chromulinivorax destructor]
MLEPSLKATEDKNGASLGCESSMQSYDIAELILANSGGGGHVTLI